MGGGQSNVNEGMLERRKSSRIPSRSGSLRPKEPLLDMAPILTETVVGASVAGGAHEYIARRIVELVPDLHPDLQPVTGRGRQHLFRDELKITLLDVSGGGDMEPIPAHMSAQIHETAMLQYVFRLWNVGGDGKLRQREVVKVLLEINTDPVLCDEYFEEIVLVMFGKNVYLSFDVFAETVCTNPLCRSLLEGIMSEAATIAPVVVAQPRSPKRGGNNNKFKAQFVDEE